MDAMDAFTAHETKCTELGIARAKVGEISPAKHVDTKSRAFSEVYMQKCEPFYHSVAGRYIPDLCGIYTWGRLTISLT